MPELRLTLLVVGLIFLVGLAWWELRRPHQARGSDLPRPAPEPLERTAEMSALSRTHSSELDLPRMSARYTESDLPVIEVGPADFAALQARAESASPGVQTQTASPARSPATEGVDGLLVELGANQIADPPISESDFAASDGGHAQELEPFAEASMPLAETVAEPVAEAWTEPVGVPDVPIASDVAVTPVVVDWPAADASQVIAVRLVTMGEKFSGRAVRMALAAEGFVIGKFSIFHKPASDGRALLSVASLTKPGTFDAQTIDLQRYGGLNLFTVLPGPLPGPDAVDELLACAQLLAQRLRGALQDEQGEPLSPARTAAMRDLAAAAQAHA